MTLQRDDAWAAVHDPVTDASTLAAVAHSYPEFGAVIERHPNSYDGLNEWLRANRASVVSSVALAEAPVTDRHPADALGLLDEVSPDVPTHYRGRAGARLWASVLILVLVAAVMPALNAPTGFYWGTLAATVAAACALAVGIPAAIVSGPSRGRRTGAAVLMGGFLAGALLGMLVPSLWTVGGFVTLLLPIVLFIGWALTRPIRGAGYAALAILVAWILAQILFTAPLIMLTWNMGSGGIWLYAIVAALLSGGVPVLVVWAARSWSDRSERRNARVEPERMITAPGATNTLAIAAFICVFFISLPAVIMGHLALSRIRVTNEGGRGLAVAALAIGYSSMAITVIILIVAALGMWGALFSSISTEGYSTYY